MDTMRTILGMIVVLGLSGAVQAGQPVELPSQRETGIFAGLHPVCLPGQTREYIYNAQGAIVGWKCAW